MMKMYLSFLRFCVSISMYTSFGVSGTWIYLMFVAIFTVSVDPPRLTESLRSRLNQARTRQEVIALVTIVVTTETTSLPRPSWSQLRKRGVSGVVAYVFTCSQHVYSCSFESFSPLKVRAHVRPSPDAGRLYNSHGQKTEQISGCADGLLGCTQGNRLDVMSLKC